MIEDKNRMILNTNFLLRVEAHYDLPCKSIKGFQYENEYEYIQEGGLNDYVHLRRKPASKPYTLQVERYVGVGYFDPLPVGCVLELPLVLFVTHFSGRFEHPRRVFVFSGCTVISKDYGDLNAEQSGLLTETTTIAFQRLEVTEETAEEPKLPPRTISPKPKTVKRVAALPRTSPPKPGAVKRVAVLPRTLPPKSQNGKET